MKTEPNKAMEPIPVNVTSPADAGLAPFTSMAHLRRSLKKMKLFALLLALWPIAALADVESSLAKSPDGRFELILTASSEKDYGRVIVRDLKSGATTETDSGQGYGYFPSGDVEAVWKASSDSFAVTMRGTKRTWNTDVYIREGDAWEKLEFPP